MQIRAAVCHEKSGKWTMEDLILDEPRADEVLVKVIDSGICQTDVHARDGYFPKLPWPAVYGHEGAGVVEAVGPGVDYLKAGDRVAYAGGPPGSYSEVRLIPADRLVKIPDGITDMQAAAMMLKGLTVQ